MLQKSRLERLSLLLDRAHLDKLIVASDLTICYLLGNYTNSMERFHVLLVDRAGGFRYFANALFEVPEALKAKTSVYRDGENPIDLLEGFLAPKDVVAVENGLNAEFLLDILRRFPCAGYVKGGDVLAAALSVKDGEEQRLMELSSRINDSVVGELISRISPEVSELELSGLCPGLYTEQGAADGEAYVSYGANCALPHHAVGGSLPMPGDSILIDAGAAYRRYNSDMTRTVFFADVSKEMERVYNIVLRANLEGIAAVRPGARAGEVDAVCRRIITDEGYGGYFTHRTGHGIGLRVHEGPYIEHTSDMVLEEGMIFSIEPGIYLPGVGGVRIEDLAVVTSHGCKVLNALPKELRVVSGNA